MPRADYVVRQWLGRWKDSALAGVGCLLLLLLVGCAPAVMLTKNYIENKEEPGRSAQANAASPAQVPPDQSPLLTTKNYRDATGESRESSRVYRGTLDQVWTATLLALSQLKANVTNSTRGQSGGEIEALWVGGRALALYVDQMGAETIRVKIRFGQFGDAEAENAIQARIGANL